MPSKSEWLNAARWLKNSFAEWFVGSWALLIGWVIFTTIFFNFLLMDGTFSRGLGEGSGVNPDRFQQVGWMYRLFAAAFLMLATKLSLSNLGKHAWAVRIIGGFITLIVILHATGFGLKALEGKRATATAVEAVAVAGTQSNDAIISQLRGQIADIDTQLAAAVTPINTEIFNLDHDKLAENDKRSDNLRVRRDALQDDAAKRKADINTRITDLVVSGGAAKTNNATALAKSEKWAPLFVGLAQLFTWNPQPTDWAIYVCAVLFLVFWVLVGDAIAIALPDALYRLHLQDAKTRKVTVEPDVFADLQAQAEELARRKANLEDGADRALKTKTRKKNKAVSLKILEDQRAEAVKKEAAAAQAAEIERQKIDDAIAEMRAEVVEEDEPEDTLDLTEPAPEPAAEPVEAETPPPGTDLVVTKPPAEPPAEESDDESRPLQAAE